MTCKWIEICPLRRLEKGRIIDLRWRKDYCESEQHWKECKRYQMEEKAIPHGDSMMPDGSFVDLEKN